MVELDHSFSTGKAADYNWDAVLDLDRIIPCVEGGKVLEREIPELAKAEIKVKMGAMSMTFKGTVEVHRARRGGHARGAADQVQGHRRLGLRQRRRARSRSTTAAATIHTEAEITGKAASMGEGVVATVLDALIKDFTTKLATI